MEADEFGVVYPRGDAHYTVVVTDQRSVDARLPNALRWLSWALGGGAFAAVLVRLGGWLEATDGSAPGG